MRKSRPVCTGAQPVPPHMLPVNRCDDFLSLVRKQSLERLKAVEEALRAEATSKQQSYEFNFNICTSNATEEDKPLLPTMRDIVVERAQHSVVSATQKKLHRTLNRVPNDQELLDALVAEEHQTYQAHTAANKNRGNRRRGPSPARQQARPRSRSRSPAQRQNPKNNNRSGKRQFQNRSNWSSGNSQINRLAA